MHSHGIVHCDLKPGNIFLVHVDDQGDFVTVFDFGVSRAPDAAGLPLGLIAGTPCYMPPEQALGDPYLDGRTDQFALAAMVYEMLTGQPALMRDESKPSVRALLEPEPPLLSERAPWVPAVFDAVLQRAMSRDREARYPSISRFAWELGNAAIRHGIDPEDPAFTTGAGAGRYYGAGVREESLRPPPSRHSNPATVNETGTLRGRSAPPPSRHSDPATAHEKGTLRSAPPPSPASSDARALLSAARSSFQEHDLDTAVEKAEELLSLAVHHRDPETLRTIAAGIDLIDTICTARVGPMDQSVTIGEVNPLRRRLSPHAARIIAMVDPQETVNELIHHSGIPRRHCVRLIAGLMRQGALVPSPARGRSGDLAS